jgi:D-alanyl-D-alanine carboxypeptidase
MVRMRILTAACASLVMLTACGSDDAPNVTPTVAPTVAPSNSPEPTMPQTSTSNRATSTTQPAGVAFDDALVQQYRQLIDEVASSLPAPGATVQATVLQRGGPVWDGGSQKSPVQTVRIASVGKTFTAATVFRLVESGALELDAPITDSLSSGTLDLLRSDGYLVDAITVRHLLLHTAGLYDYSFGEGSPLLDRAINDQSHVWTRREQLELAVAVGDPLAAPGEAFAYSDTAYVLLGEIIEQITGQPYADAMGELLQFDRLRIAPWMEYGQSAPPSALPIAPSFFGSTDFSDLNFSIDAFGGGGLAATTRDVAVFFDALLAGDVFDETSTLDEMLKIPSTNIGATDFGVPFGDGAAGIYRVTVDGSECWSHRGFLGTIVLSCPSNGVTVVVTTNTALTEPLPLAESLLRAALG